MNKLIFWFLFLVTVFAIAYTATDLTIKYVMADFSVEPEPTYTQQLEVKPNYGTRTDQYTPIQPAVTPVGKEF